MRTRFFFRLRPYGYTILLPVFLSLILCCLLLFFLAFSGFSLLLLIVISLCMLQGFLLVEIFRHKKSAGAEESRQRQTSAQISSVYEGDVTENRYQYLIDTADIGIFRTTVGEKSRFIEANPACISILGLTSEDELFSVPAWDLFLDSSERTTFFKTFARNGSVSKYPLRLYHRDGKLATVLISAIFVRNQEGKPIYCDGFLEDVTNSLLFEKEQKKLIDELQTAQLFLNTPVGESVSEKVVSCTFSTTVAESARFMTEKDCGAVLVRPTDNSEYVGIVTDNDIRKRVVAENLGSETKVSSIMSAPLISIKDDARMFEALLMILDKNIDHIIVKNRAGNVTKVIGAKQFLKNQKYPLALLLRDINKAVSFEQLLQVKERLPLLIQSSYSSTTDPVDITRIISTLAEAVTKKCLDFAFEELGPPPCHYAFLALGSVGREEQTLVTDQDNALIYDDINQNKKEVAEDYFNMVSKSVCSWLDRVGYSFCKGDIMAMNPRWCQPLSVWMGYFKQWVSTLEPADLLETKIFFDFRGVDGDMKLVEKLRTHMHEMVESKPLFLFHLVNNCRKFKPPLGIFKNILVESSGQNKEKFDVKKAMTPVVDLARVYGLKYKIRDTGTLDRLKKLKNAGHFSDSEYLELSTAYRYLLDLRFKYQIRSIEDGKPPGNHINPKNLTEIEQATLREVLTQINSFQTKMSFDFTGSA